MPLPFSGDGRALGHKPGIGYIKSTFTTNNHPNYSRDLDEMKKISNCMSKIVRIL